MTNNINYYLWVINTVLDILYSKEQDLFKYDICERAIVFRFSYYLQKKLKKLYVDCDYNASFYTEWNWIYIPIRWKAITDDSWNLTKRFIDIIVRSKRDLANNRRHRINTDILCFECKKRDNYDKEWHQKDIDNIKCLTTEFWYNYWFLLKFWKEREKCEIDIYERWEKLVLNSD